MHWRTTLNKVYSVINKCISDFAIAFIDYNVDWPKSVKDCGILCSMSNVYITIKC